MVTSGWRADDPVSQLGVHRATSQTPPVDNPRRKVALGSGSTGGEKDMGTREELSPLLLTPEEVAEVLRVGRSRVYDLMRSHRLVSVKIGGSRRVPIAAVRKFVDELVEHEVA